MRSLVAAAALAGLLGAIAAHDPLMAQAGALPPAATTQVEFTRDIEPILRARCYSCHGEKQQMSGLRLDRAEDALRGGYSGPIIEVGNSAASKLVLAVAGVEKPIMPMGGAPLSSDEVGLLRAWIDQGASWPAETTASAEAAAAPAPASAQPSHWSFRPVARPGMPSVRNRAWVRNPIDAFVMERLQREGVSPSPEASKATLMRRVSLDLTGLPPSPLEVDEFLADNSPDAYERVVDRLLLSPHYGEKWGRHWLDLARYADSDGYRRDELRPHAWRYRHWVVDALNRDMPFDQFTIEQIAGDLLPNATVDQKTATGFHRNAMANRESGIDNEQTRVEQVVDRTNTVGTVWLGVTVGCAQCHNHKYDPLTQKEYYQLFAFFNDVEDVNIDAPLPGEMGPYLREVAAYRAKRQELLQQYRVPALMREWEKHLLEAAANPGQRVDWDNALTELRSSEAQPLYNQGEKVLRIAPEHRTEKQERLLVDHFIVNYRRVITPEERKTLRFEELRKQLEALDAGFPALSQAQAIVNEAEPRQSHILLRGDHRSPGIPVERGVPAFLHAMPPDPAPSRLTLARWIVSSDNPLTPRVTVNRLWQELFGRGLAATSDDFGTQGEPPSHPELLDWLAAEFVDGGWSWKRIVKTMVMSATYRQSSAASPALMSRDPSNVLLARQARLRLPAELIRDSALAVSGLLDPTVGGKSVRPPLPESATAAQFGSTWSESTGAERYRRGLYILYQRLTPYPMLANFDMPDSYAAACERDRSNTALQALNLLNDPAFFEAAQALAARILTEVPGGSLSDRLDYAFRLALARPPATDEREWLIEAVGQQQQMLRGRSGPSVPFADVLGVDRNEAAAWVGVSSILLNLDEFVTRE